MELSNLLKLNSLELNDSNSCYKYEDIIPILAKINQYLTEQNITNGDFIVWECENTVSSAIAILYFLINHYSFVLIPSNSGQTIYNFCRYYLRNIDNINEKNSWKIIPNSNWNGQKADPNLAKLYVRTSGTTGEPKLVVHCQEKLLQNALNCAERLSLKSEDKITIPVPIYHLFGLGAALLPSVIVGAKINLQPNTNLLKYLESERQFEPNITFLTPSFAETLIKGRRKNRPYKLTVIAGDYLKPETFVKYEQKMGKIAQLYGSTEMGVMAVGNPNDSPEIRSSFVGKPLTGVTFKLTKIDDFVGELWCNHSHCFLGYINHNGDLIESYQNNWFFTKDLAKINNEGYIKVLGRSDHSVNRDGLLVLFSDIETAISEIEGIETVVAISQGETQRGKGIIVYCICQKKVNLTSEKIRKICFTLLPRHAVPDQIRIIDTLPLLPNGKINRQNL